MVMYVVCVPIGGGMCAREGGEDRHFLEEQFEKTLEGYGSEDIGNLEEEVRGRGLRIYAPTYPRLLSHLSN